MKAEELMIGDWVRVKDHPECCFQMEDVSGTVLFKRWTKDGEYMIPYSYSEIEPIPLTPEILEKNGWKIDGIKRGRFYWNEIAPFYIPVGEGWSEKDEKVFYDDFYGYVLMRLITVHELQHALRLCGIDKQITI